MSQKFIESDALSSLFKTLSLTLQIKTICLLAKYLRRRWTDFSQILTIFLVDAHLPPIFKLLLFPKIKLNCQN